MSKNNTEREWGEGVWMEENEGDKEAVRRKSKAF
jgi:hypothetical protein